MEISPQEKYLIEIVRQLRPFESIEIVKDKQGKPNTFLVKRSQKVMISEIAILEVK